MARKNGKTLLTAALALVHLVGPEKVTNGEIYAAATEREQAGIVFRYAAQIVRAEPLLMQYIKIVDSTKTMVAFDSGSVFRAVSAEAGTKMGYNPSVIIYDELAQAKNRDLYDALDTSMAARLEPLFIVISTQSNDPQHILSTLIDDGLSGRDPSTVCHLYAVPDDAPGVFDDVKLWKLANPALGDFRSLSEMRTAAKRAKRMPSFESSFRNLYLNQRVNAVAAFVSPSTWKAGNAPPAELTGRVYGGLDLSATTDLTALVLTCRPEGLLHVVPYFWMPADSVEDAAKRDRAPYDVWVKHGFLRTTPGKVIDYDFVARDIGEITAGLDIAEIGFDRWRMDRMQGALDRQGVTLPLKAHGQGFKDMSPALDALESDLLSEVVRHGGHPVLAMCAANAVAVNDPAGNRKLVKDKSTGRIDGMVALAMAEGVEAMSAEAPAAVSPWDDPEFSMVSA